jgi:hypothetical protein
MIRSPLLSRVSAFVAAGVLAGCAGNVSDADVVAARNVVREYARAYAQGNAARACALMTSSLRQVYVETREVDTCEKAFTEIRRIDLGDSKGVTVVAVDVDRSRPMPSGAINGSAMWGLPRGGSTGTEVDAIKVQGHWRIYLDTICETPDDCPVP